MTSPINPKIEQALAHARHGYELQKSDDFEGAISYYTVAIQLDPTLPNVHRFRGICHYQLQDFGEAIANFDEELCLNPNNAELYFYRGKAREKAGDMNGAIADLIESVQLAPEVAKTVNKLLGKLYSKRAFWYEEQQDFERALSDIREAIRFKPSEAEILHGIEQSILRQSAIQQLSVGNERAVNEPDQVLSIVPIQSSVSVSGEAPTQHVDIDKYIQAMQTFIEREHQLSVEAVQKIWKLPIEQRVERHEAIANIYAIKSTQKMKHKDGKVSNVEFLVLRYQHNKSRFRRGDVVCLNNGNPESSGIMFALPVDPPESGELYVKMSVFADTLTFLDANIETYLGPDRILDKGYLDNRRILRGSLDQLNPNHPISNITLGDMTPQFDPMRQQEANRLIDNVFALHKLNPSQKEAFVQAYSTDNFFVVQGPPGTGKTKLLGYLAVALAQSGKRILLAAMTHSAVDTALQEIVSASEQLNWLTGNQIFRIGAEDDNLSDKAIKPYTALGRGKDGHYKDLPPDQGFIVGATCYAAQKQMHPTDYSKNGQSLSGLPLKVDIVIFDEASQLTLPVAIAGMLPGPRYVFFGDHRQTAPVILGKDEYELWLQRSVFESIFSHYPGITLDTTYRMNDKLCAFPSARFYGGKLKPDGKVTENRLKFVQLPQQFLDILDPNNPNTFVSFDHGIAKAPNAKEAKLAAALVLEASICGVQLKDIAIITPYNDQVAELKRQIRSFVPNQRKSELYIGTIHGMQGKEREMVIVSLAVSDRSFASWNATLLFDPKLLNVAITRAKTKCIVIASPNLLEIRSSQHQEWIEHFEAFHDSCHQVSYSGDYQQVIHNGR